MTNPINQMTNAIKKGRKKIRNRINYLSSISISNIRIRQLKKKPIKNTPVKIGFIVQMPELWGKLESVFQQMLENKAFDPWIIIVPRYDYEKSRIGDFDEGKEFFISASKGKYILAKQGQEWHDILKDNYEYVFYQRPYDHYLPDKLKSSYVSKKCRICYIPYATPEMKNTTIYPLSFFMNIYFGFMEDETAAQYNNNRFHNKSKTRFVNLGYPPFQKSMSLETKCNYKSVLWTPRWSYDPVIGGSHFFEYVNQLTDYPWGEMSLTVRPHPMMWSNFLKEKRIDEAGITKIHNTWSNVGIAVDKNEEIELTFQSTDILISDRSSIIPLFFLTGKPIIYCEVETDYGSLFSDVMPGLYIANSWEELEKYLTKLLSGNDPKKPIRDEIIKNKFAHHIDASENIVKYIYDDIRTNKGGRA